MNRIRTRSLMLAASWLGAVALAGSADAQRTQTGTINGRTYTATNAIIGQTSTATLTSNGNPIYAAKMPQYSGVVALIMNQGAKNFICSGSLIGAQTILTAGHCVSQGYGKITTQATTAYFYSGVNGDPATYNPDTVITASPLSTKLTVDKVWVNPSYTGKVIDDHDVAILHLSSAAPDFAKIYGLSDATDLTGLDFNVAGYGGRSDAGGSIGDNLGTGRLRQGDNRFDYRLGDPAFGGLFTDPNFYGSTANYSYIADFDDGTDARDASCIVAESINPALNSSKYCNLGRGMTEASVAGGDSGGPQFVNGKIASVTSYGLSFGTDFGDLDNKLNSTFGEFAGYVPVFHNRAFIDQAAAAGVPEPAGWAMMLAGFAAVGAMMRRRKVTTTVRYA